LPPVFFLFIVSKDSADTHTISFPIICSKSFITISVLSSSAVAIKSLFNLSETYFIKELSFGLQLTSPIVTIAKIL
jgi:hypothetical protein